MFLQYKFKTVVALICVALVALNSWAQVMSTQEYIDAYKYAAMQEMKVYNIPASITLGQGILESGSGNSRLAKDCNNHFGIKCRAEWTGPYCLINDDAPNECFRGYPSVMESYRDHSLFLKNGSRYNSLFSLQVSDYEGWANGLKQAGYATNPAYANTLTGIIKKYRLSIYDSMVLFGEDFISPDTSAQRQILVHGLPAVYASKGQTPEEIAKLNNMGNWQIYKYNDLKRGEHLNPGDIVYLKPKKRKADIAEVVVKEGESMRDISQQQGIKLKQLYKKNHLKPGQQVKPGQVLSLQSKSSTTPVVLGPTEILTRKETTAVEIPKVDKVDKNAGFHEVKAGETLFSIASLYEVSVEDLMEWNNLTGTGLKAGQVLLLKKGVKPSGKDSTGAATRVEIGKSVKYHVVIAGETLYSIAKMYNTPIDSIIKWNRLQGNALYPGQELVVNPGGSKPVNATAPITYTVQPGDTLYSIARKYGISAEALKSKNKLENDNIIPGQVLNL